MMVNPVYQEGWLLPGGIVETDESPLAAAKRELAEELGLQTEQRALRLLGIDYSGAWQQFKDVLHIIFDGGVLLAADESYITMNLDELGGYRFFTINELLAGEAGFSGRRLGNLLKNNQPETTYLEWGKEIV